MVEKKHISYEERLCFLLCDLNFEKCASYFGCSAKRLHEKLQDRWKMYLNESLKNWVFSDKSAFQIFRNINGHMIKKLTSRKLTLAKLY